jgi:hypothetical protein
MSIQNSDILLQKPLIILGLLPIEKLSKKACSSITFSAITTLRDLILFTLICSTIVSVIMKASEVEVYSKAVKTLKATTKVTKARRMIPPDDQTLKIQDLSLNSA